MKILTDKILAITNPSSSPFNKGGQEGDYLTNTAKQAKVREYEKQIDELACLCVSARRQVYKLYKLTPEEIKIVEGQK